MSSNFTHLDEPARRWWWTLPLAIGLVSIALIGMTLGLIRSERQVHDLHQAFDQSSRTRTVQIAALTRDLAALQSALLNAQLSNTEKDAYIRELTALLIADGIPVPAAPKSHARPIVIPTQESSRQPGPSPTPAPSPSPSRTPTSGRSPRPSASPSPTSFRLLSLPPLPTP